MDPFYPSKEKFSLACLTQLTSSQLNYILWPIVLSPPMGNALYVGMLLSLASMPYGIVREIKKFGLSTLLVFTFLTCTILMLLSFCRACEILNPLDILVFSLIASPL